MCPICLVPIAGLVAIIIALIYFCKDMWNKVTGVAKKWVTPMPKQSDDKPAVTVVETTVVPMGTEIKPPITGPDATRPPTPSKEVTFTDEGKHPDTETSAPMAGSPTQAFVPLPKGGLSCPNKRWYDSIYNGGVYTEIAIPGIEEADMKKLWRKDYRSMGYNGQFAWGDDRGPRAAYQAPPWRNMFI